MSMSSRRLFDGALIELGLLPLEGGGWIEDPWSDPVAETTGAILLRLLAESVELSESNARMLAMLRLIAENIATTDDTDTFLGLIRSISEQVTSSETDLAVRSLLRLLTETVGISEVDIYIRGLIRQSSETMEVTEADSRLRQLLAIIEETLGIDELVISYVLLIAPTGLIAVAQSPYQIDVSWDAVADADAYDLERDSVIIVEKTALTSYEDTGLTPATEYTYRVRSARLI